LCRILRVADFDHSGLKPFVKIIDFTECIDSFSDNDEDSSWSSVDLDDDNIFVDDDDIILQSATILSAPTSDYCSTLSTDRLVADIDQFVSSMLINTHHDGISNAQTLSSIFRTLGQHSWNTDPSTYNDISTNITTEKMTMVDNVTCSVCEAANQCISLHCNHSYCHSCWATYLQIQLQRKSRDPFLVTCMDRSCQEKIHYGAWVEFVCKDDQLKNRFTLALVEYLLTAHSSIFKKCINPECTMIGKCSAGDKSVVMNCSCGSTWCFKCASIHIGNHFPLKCHQIDRLIAYGATRSLEVTNKFHQLHVAIAMVREYHKYGTLIGSQIYAELHDHWKADVFYRQCPTCKNHIYAPTIYNSKCACCFYCKEQGQLTTICWFCESKWYPSHQCEQPLQFNLDRKSPDAASIEWMVSNTRMCPKCNMGIERIVNCQSITCLQSAGGCGFKFCWDCANACSDGACCNQVFDTVSGKIRIENALSQFTSTLSLQLTSRFNLHRWSAMATIPSMIATLIQSEALCFWTVVHLLVSDISPSNHTLAGMFLEDLKNAIKTLRATWDSGHISDANTRKTHLFANLSVIKRIRDTLVESLHAK
jgi:hypothetical protein